MSQNKENNKEAGFENVESALTRSERFIEDNQKNIFIGAIAIVVIVAGFWGVKKLIFHPREQKAQSEMFFAQHYFGSIIYIRFSISFRNKRHGSRCSWIGFNNINSVIFNSKLNID